MHKGILNGSCNKRVNTVINGESGDFLQYLNRVFLSVSIKG